MRRKKLIKRFEIMFSGLREHKVRSNPQVSWG